MSPAVGSRLGTYDIVALVGAGGMGEVYRAHDTKLNRQVALKVRSRSVRFQARGEMAGFDERRILSGVVADEAGIDLCDPHRRDDAFALHGGSRVLSSRQAVAAVERRDQQPAAAATVRSAPDGDRIAAFTRRDAASSKIDRLRVVVNYFDELRRVAPVTKK
jgi:serine/threonine protein kinase